MTHTVRPQSLCVVVVKAAMNQSYSTFVHKTKRVWISFMPPVMDGSSKSLYSPPGRSEALAIGWMQSEQAFRRCRRPCRIGAQRQPLRPRSTLASGLLHARIRMHGLHGHHKCGWDAFLLVSLAFPASPWLTSFGLVSTFDTSPFIIQPGSSSCGVRVHASDVAVDLFVTAAASVALLETSF